jgi:thiosulfate/3-mercaptopyruvate sulfurtransferase
MAEYAHPDILVTTDWVAEHGGHGHVRLVEVDVDSEAYEEGHIAGAVGLNWTSQLCDQVRRDVLTRKQFEALCCNLGIRNDTTVVFYGDSNNWFACYALWQFKLYGHEEKRLKLMNGGRAKWLAEKRPLTDEPPHPPRTDYRAAEQDLTIRAFKEDLFAHLNLGDINIIDVRSPAEFTGEVIAPPGMNETAQRSGHVPSAKSVPWALTVDEDGCFKAPGELRALYQDRGVDLGKDTITYCRIGERSSHTWFVLAYLLGVPRVSNYDGSWTEWGNLVGAPIERP